MKIGDFTDIRYYKVGMSDNGPTILMTGATGFLGNFILRDLLNRRRRVVALLRSPFDENRRRLVSQLAQIGLDAEQTLKAGQLSLIEGSLPDSLPRPTWGRTDAILSNAASLELFATGNGNPYLTNVSGAEAIIRWADEQSVQDIHTVSTAYTCGWNDGCIRETFHDPQPEFQTDYERSKWQAESLFQRWSQQTGHTLTVYRPSLLVGDSKTGYTTQFGGFYQFARMVSALKERYRDPNNGDITHIPLRIPGRPEDVQNVVPVDFVSRIIAEVVSKSEFHGRIYHLTNPEPPTNDLMKRCYEDYFGLEGGYFTDADEVVNQCTSAESMLWDHYHLVTPRVVHTPRFDTSNMRQVMEAIDISFPLLDRDRIFMLFDWAATRNWGRSSSSK